MAACVWLHARMSLARMSHLAEDERADSVLSGMVVLPLERVMGPSLRDRGHPIHILGQTENFLLESVLTILVARLAGWSHHTAQLQR